MLTILSVAYPLAPVGPHTAGGEEQVLSGLDRALVRAGHHSIVVACEGSQGCGTLVPFPTATAPLDDTATRLARARARRAMETALTRWPSAET